MTLTLKTMMISSLASITGLSIFGMTGLIPPPVEAPPEIKEEKIVEVKKEWQCPTCNENEKKTLKFLQARGIVDKNALSVVLGNIKQESKFTPNICEGGAIVPYKGCYSGGYGLIQWTTPQRYYGLGAFSEKYGGSPSSIETQLRYMVNEPEWISYEPYLKQEGYSIKYYMHHAYSWLGWGIHGSRTYYAYNYLEKLIWS